MDESWAHLGEEDHADEQNKRPYELDGYGDLPGRVIWAILGGIVEDRSEENADRDSKLIPANDRTTDPLGGALGLVHGDKHGDEANAKASEEATGNEGGKVARTSLKGDTEGEDDAGGHDAEAATEDVSGGSPTKST